MALSADVLSKMLQDADEALDALSVTPELIERALNNPRPQTLDEADDLLSTLGVPLEFSSLQPSQPERPADEVQGSPANEVAANEVPADDSAAAQQVSSEELPTTEIAVAELSDPEDEEVMNQLFEGFDEKETEGSISLSHDSLSQAPAPLGIDIDPPDDSIFPTASIKYFKSIAPEAPVEELNEENLEELDIEDLQMLDPDDDIEEEVDKTVISSVAAFESMDSAQEDGASPSTIPLTIESEEEDPNDPDGEKKGFFKKLFGN